jgi:deoxyadenosine/deoxycytidine kinase
MIDGVLNYRIAGDLEQLCGLLSEARRTILGQRTAVPVVVPLVGRARPYVAVTGTIGVGKSTLVRLLGRRPGWSTIDEPVEENPYLQGVYQNLEGLALRVQAFYLGGRTRQHMRALEVQGPVVQDRCLYEDTEVFAATYHEMGAFDTTDLGTLRTLYRALAELLPRPDLLVYVHAPLEVQLARIRRRGREFEQTMDETFLTRLRANYEAWIDRQNWAPVLRIDSSAADYENDPAAQQSVLQRIDRALEESASFAPGRLFARVTADVD